MNEQEALGSHRAGIYRFLHFFTQNREVSEEITQETFRVALSRETDLAIRAAQRSTASQSSKGTSYAAWLRAIAKNLLRNYRRKQQSGWLFFTDDVLEGAERRFVAAGADRDNLWEARRKALLSCVQRLSEANRRLVLLRYQAGEKVQEMASGMGLAPNALSKRLERIREALRNCVNSILWGGSHG
jgi:RNA polymerase sigma-70 factor (ECF subfamily)